MGPHGLLPAGEYLEQVASVMGHARYWFAPTLLWLGSGSGALELLCWIGLIASVLLTANLWPRGMLVACFVSFLSIIAAAQDFSGYQSDGMLLSAGFVSIFFAAPGWRPGWGEAHLPSRGSMFLLQWIWFTIYFESGVAKLAGGDPQWRHYGDGRVLPERAAAHVDRLVRAASSALVSRGCDGADTARRTGYRVDVIPAAALSHPVFLGCYAI